MPSRTQPKSVGKAEKQSPRTASAPLSIRHPIRPATLDDIPILTKLEERCFAGDRLTRRQFRYMLTKAHAETLVSEVDGDVLGYVLILFSRGVSAARLYSIAVTPESRGRGIGKDLVLAAEDAARDNDYAYLRLEVRKDNSRSISLFRRLGYDHFGEYEDYYEDHMDAWRFQKSLATEFKPGPLRIPFYRQTLDFTCGPASLMMAMHGLDPELRLDRKLELRLWREATTIFMLSGHGGCGPYGLALAAARRGFRVEVYLSDEGVHLRDSVRDEEKREVMRLTQEDMRDEMQSLGIPIIRRRFPIREMEAKFEEGGVPLVLISTFQISGQKSPHWVVVTGFDEHFVYVHDPFVDFKAGESTIDSIHMPILKRQFERMARYGRTGFKAAVVLYRSST